jgi:hypothetical protein
VGFDVTDQLLIVFFAFVRYLRKNGNKEVGLEVNEEKTKYKLLSGHQNVGRNHDIKLAKSFFENIWERQ